MKNITKILIALFAIVAFSCTQDDVENRPVITSKDAPVLTAPSVGATYVLTPENASATAERFTWDSANFGGDVVITYSVQMDVKGGDFTSASTLGSVPSANQIAVSVEVMNNAALALGAAPFEATEFNIRVVATTGVSTSIVSESTTGIVITPYTTESPKLWVPGGYQAASGYGADWTPSSAPQIQAAGYGKTAFEGYVYFATAQNGSLDGQGFLFNPAANWDHKYGQGATEGTLTVDGGSNLSVTPAGYYLVKADTDPAKLTYSLTETKWGIIGSATSGGWDNSTAMTYDKDTRLWKITATLTSGAWKFRANNSWDINLGALKPTADGVNLEYGGGDISVDAGTYTITLDLSTPRVYKYTITKN
jgi:starch-binding outer membrane protein SusE/F